MTSLTIGKLSAESGTTAVTIRYYERIKLIPKPLRSPAGYRLYSIGTLKTLRFIAKAKILGLSLNDIKQLLALYASKNKNSMKGRSKIDAQLESVEAKVKDLQVLASSLKRLTTSCDGSMPTSKCPILQEMFEG
jgi:DNA-binding transcriptional MerR regulator